LLLIKDKRYFNITLFLIKNNRLCLFSIFSPHFIHTGCKVLFYNDNQDKEKTFNPDWRNIMTSTKNKLLLGLALVSLSSVGLAFGWGGGPGYGAGPGGGYRIAKELNLSTEQQEQMQTIMQQHREEGQQWREQHRTELETKLGNVLTADQLEQFKAFKQQGPFGRGMKSRGQGPYGKGMGGYGRGQGPCDMRPY